MDFVNKMTGSGNNNQQTGSNEQSAQGSASGQQQSGGGGFLGGIGDKLNSAAGGGKESEKNEDYLDKGTIPGSLLEFAWLKIYRCRLRAGKIHGRWCSGQRGMPST